MAQYLYIANCTRQVQEVHYRLDFSAEGVRVPFKPATRQKIDPGHQAMIGNGALHPAQIESLVQQLSSFGMVAASEIGRTKRKVRQVFNLDKPVSAKLIRDVMDMNAGYLTTEGRQRRQAAAVATNDIIANAVTNDFAARGIPKEPTQAIDVEFEQLEQSEAGESRVEEGYRVRDNAPDAQPPRRGRVKKAA